MERNTEIRETPAEVWDAEDRYNAYASTLDGQWGEEQNAELARLAAELHSLYERYNVDEFDRVAL